MFQVKTQEHFSRAKLMFAQRYHQFLVLCKDFRIETHMLSVFEKPNPGIYYPHFSPRKGFKKMKMNNEFEKQ